MWNTPEALQRSVGSGLVPGKLSITPKKAPVKYRFIVDLRRNGVNATVRFGERVVLPRLSDLAKTLGRAAQQRSTHGAYNMAVLDGASAFHLVRLAKEERRYLAVTVPHSAYDDN